MGISFLNPLLLAGLLAAAIPVVLHFLNRRQAKILPISTLRFLRLVPAKTLRRKRLEEYLLLLARVLLFALLALGAARPVLTDARAGGGATATAIVLDDSYSMETRADGVTRFQEAVEASLRTLRTLAAGDRAALLVASDPEAETFTSDLPALRRRLSAARPSSSPADLLPAAQKALALLREAREPNRELVLVTDLQRLAVRPLVERLPVEPEDRGISVLLLDVGAEAPANLTLASVRAEAGIAVAGEPARVTVEVRNSSGRGLSTRLALVVGEERVLEQAVSVDAGETAMVPLRVTADLPGAESGRVTLAGDDLLADDVRHFALPVLARIPVLLVNGDPSPVSWQDEAFFLRAALAPEELGAERVQSPFNVKTVPAEALGGEDLRPYRAVILANVAALGAKEATALRAFVRSGGGLMLFAGNRLRPDEMNRSLSADPAEGLLPAVLGPPADLGGGPEDLVPLAEFEAAHALFADLPAEALEDLPRIHARRAISADAGPAGGRVVARLRNGAPLIVEKTVGAGRTLLVTVTADADWTNLPLRPMFLPLLHRALLLLAGGEAGARAHLLGETVKIPPAPEADAPPEVRDPGGEITRLAGEGAALSYGPLRASGVYAVKGSGAGDFLFCADPDPREGDLARGDPDALRDLFGPDRFRHVRGLSALEAEVERAREGRPLWGFLLAAALLLLLFEGAFANRLAAARADRPAAGKEGPA